MFYTVLVRSTDAYRLGTVNKLIIQIMIRCAASQMTELFAERQQVALTKWNLLTKVTAEDSCSPWVWAKMHIKKEKSLNDKLMFMVPLIINDTWDGFVCCQTDTEFLGQYSCKYLRFQKSIIKFFA